MYTKAIVEIWFVTVNTGCFSVQHQAFYTFPQQEKTAMTLKCRDPDFGKTNKQPQTKNNNSNII